MQTEEMSKYDCVLTSLSDEVVLIFQGVYLRRIETDLFKDHDDSNADQVPLFFELSSEFVPNINGTERVVGEENKLFTGTKLQLIQINDTDKSDQFDSFKSCLESRGIITTCVDMNSIFGMEKQIKNSYLEESVVYFGNNDHQRSAEVTIQVLSILDQLCHSSKKIFFTENRMPQKMKSFGPLKKPMHTIL
jgi:hypothetical protein